MHCQYQLLLHELNALLSAKGALAKAVPLNLMPCFSTNSIPLTPLKCQDSIDGWYS